jgi:hypothetical protein
MYLGFHEFSTLISTTVPERAVEGRQGRMNVSHLNNSHAVIRSCLGSARRKKFHPARSANNALPTASFMHCTAPGGAVSKGRASLSATTFLFTALLFLEGRSAKA